MQTSVANPASRQSSCCPWAGSGRPTCQLLGGRAHGGLAGWPTGFVSSARNDASRKWSTLGSTNVLQTGYMTPAAAQQSGSRRSSSSMRCSAGSSVGSESGSVQACPLHACLQQYGISDLAAFSTPKHLALSQEAVSRDVAPKLAALAAEGLSPKQMKGLLSYGTSQCLTCSYSSTFQPNLQLLRQMAAYREHEVHPECPELTAGGKLLLASRGHATQYLARDPRKVQQLLQWLESNLGIGLQQLAACSRLCRALRLPAATVQDISEVLQQRQLSVEQLGRLVVVAPDVFAGTTSTLSARLRSLENQLQLPAEAALQVLVRQPKLITVAMDVTLPPLLRFLDTYMGTEGAGRRLFLTQPALGTSTATIVQRRIGALELAAPPEEVRKMIDKQPTMLMINFNTPLQQQKLAWVAQSPWTLDIYLSNPRYLVAKTRRLAARLALLRESGLQPPASPAVLATYSDARFMASVRKQLEGQGPELPWDSWAEWERAWLGTDEGKRWGFPPLKT